MPIPNWPTTSNFPQVPQKGFTESLGINVIRSQMDSGIAKQRVRGTRPDTMDLSFILTTAHCDILETFIKDTLRGVKRFNFPHPRKLGTTVEVRIVPQQDGEFYRLEYLAPGFWKTSLKFEVLP